MKNFFKEYKYEIIIGLLIILLVALIIFKIYLAAKYANTPAGEVPFWVTWFFNGTSHSAGK